jgi:hypothetical protein
MTSGRTLKLFLVDGVPSGLLTAEIMNWTGHVITGPRSRLSELIQRPEARRTGVYFLVGPDSGQGVGTQVYIGETDEVAQRLTTHNRPEQADGRGGKDFWEKVCVVSSKDANLTKGHIKYLESQLINMARQAGRCELLNGTDPRYDNLPEADRSDMEFFLEQIQTLLPVLGFDFLRKAPQVSAAAPLAIVGGAASQQVVQRPAATDSPVFIGDVRKHEITARGQEINGEFVVFKGSKARADWEGAEIAYTALYKELARNGVLALTADGRHREFTRDHAFSSPSAAASVVAGRSANGRTHWVAEGSGQTYAAWQEARVNQALAQVAAEPDRNAD